MRFTRSVLIGIALAVLAAGSARAAELSTSDRLQDRREVAAGTRAYSVGFEDGRFYANGWHITGEMGGVWTPPLKLVDGVWFGVNGQWAGQARRFTSGWGYTRYRLPSIDGLELERTDVVPDGVRGALFGLKLTNSSRDTRNVTVTVDARSELMGQYPWGFTGVTPNASRQPPRQRQLHRPLARVPRPGRAPGRPGARLRGVRRLRQAPARRPYRRRLLGRPVRSCLHRHRAGPWADAERVR